MNDEMQQVIKDEAIYVFVITAGNSKTKAANKFDCSPRSIGRAIDRHQERMNGTRPMSEEALLYLGLGNYEDDSTDESSDDSSDDYSNYSDDYSSDDDWGSTVYDFGGDDSSDDDSTETEYDEEEFCIYHVVASKDSITLTRVDYNDETESVTVNDTHENWNEINDFVWDTRGSQAGLAAAYALASLKFQIESMEIGGVLVDVRRGVVTYNGRDIPQELRNRIVQAGERGDADSMEGLCCFADRLMKNPSNRAVNGLYRFLEAADIQITPVGLVRCFKRVRDNYTDVHSGTFDNSIGTVVEVERNQVDEDCDRTCSYGLHVCSFKYLGSFHGDRVVEVLVDPSDFVAVPRDYNNAKARVCRYEVVSDLTDSYIAGKLG